MDKIEKVLITKSGKKFFAKSLKEDLHTQYGFIKKQELQDSKDGGLLKTNTDKELFIFSPSFSDIYRKIKRDAQIIPLKDIGAIITETGINKSSRILDSGSGSGALSCFLASVAKEVVTYEIRDDFIEIVKKNIEFLGLKNIEIKKMNIYEEVEEKNIDVVTLDLPEPWKAIESCSKALKPGGFLVSYSPSVPQVSDFVNAIRQNENFVYLRTVEIFEREWEVEERKVRPKSQGIGHSGFLTFARKVS
ncbi:MAG TPA: methyltransferase domain-containing protein [Candidatus Nanoarchaeia archaeon]|nr:methyltransferase domain-containing protein [Candidatus Nanoarchaeia archaeon]